MLGAIAERPRSAAQRERQVKIVALVGKDKTGGHDTHDLDRLAVHLHRASDYSRVAPVLSLPQAVAQDHRLIAPALIFLGAEGSAELGPHAHYVEEVR